MYRILTLAILATALARPCRAQSDYLFPVRTQAQRYSSNFGEMRPNHFHSGIDIKTDGVENIPVVAVADGYVSRLLCSPWGYGRALYITHPDGHTTVYGHLNRFREDIQKYVDQQRMLTDDNRVELYFKPGQFTVKRGEEIALSGNTGNSYGAHLHFEVRETATQRTCNTLSNGWLPVKDDLAPTIVRLHYIEVDTLRGIPLHSPRQTLDVRRGENGTYTLRRTSPLPVSRYGYFVLEATDRKNDVGNSFGLCRVAASCDDEPYFEYRMEGFTFDQSRFCNAVAYYPLQVASRNEVLRLARLEGAPADFYPVIRRRGLLPVTEGERHRVAIEVFDDCGNRSVLRFDVEGKPDGNRFRGTLGEEAPIIDRRRAFTHRQDDLTVRFPAKTFYESIPYEQECRSASPRDTTWAILSPVYRILNPDIPMQLAADVSIRCFVPADLQSKVLIAGRTRKGGIQSLGGRYEEGCVRTSTRTVGEMFVTIDTLAPKIRPRFDTARLKGARSAEFTVSDNLSGLRRISATVDGRRVLVDFWPVQARLRVTLDRSRLNAATPHRLVVRAVDECGNESRWQADF